MRGTNAVLTKLFVLYNFLKVTVNISHLTDVQNVFRPGCWVFRIRTAERVIVPYIPSDSPDESLRRFVLSLNASKAGEYISLKSSTIRQIRKDALESVGIDVKKFQGHVLRSATMAAGQKSGKTLEICLSDAMVSAKVFSLFYDLLILSIEDCASEDSVVNMDPSAAALFLADAPSAQLDAT